MVAAVRLCDDRRVILSSQASALNRGSFPNEEAVIKLVYLALRNISGKWDLPIRDWALAINRFAIRFEGRMPLE